MHCFRDEFPYAHPPLEGLETVCLIARLGSVSAAAADLGLTHGAVSRRLAAVETWLGHPLFERHGRGMRPTPDGHRFFGRIEEAFRLIGVASEPLRLRRGPEVVRVSLVPAFAEFVVLPHLTALEAGPPPLRIELTAEHRLADLDSGAMDVALRYGRGQWPNAAIHPLVPELLVPVASPALADRLGWEPSVEQILAEPLLHDSDPGCWRAWLEWPTLRVGARPQDRRFEDYTLVLAAADGGAGNCAPALADGGAGGGARAFKAALGPHCSFALHHLCRHAARPAASGGAGVYRALTKNQSALTQGEPAIWSGVGLSMAAMIGRRHSD